MVCRPYLPTAKENHMSNEGIKPVDNTVPVDDSEGAKALAEAMKPDPNYDYGEKPALPPHAPNFEKPPVAEELPVAGEVTDFSEPEPGSVGAVEPVVEE